MSYRALSRDQQSLLFYLDLYVVEDSYNYSLLVLTAGLASAEASSAFSAFGVPNTCLVPIVESAFIVARAVLSLFLLPEITLPVTSLRPAMMAMSRIAAPATSP